MIAFTAPGSPPVWARARRNGKKYFNARDHKAALAYMAVLAREAAKGRRFQGALSLEIEAFFPIPEKISPVDRARRLAGHHTQTPDADNVVKAVGDGLKKSGVIRDDAQFAVVTIVKRWSETPRTEVRVAELRSACAEAAE